MDHVDILQINPVDWIYKQVLFKKKEKLFYVDFMKDMELVEYTKYVSIQYTHTLGQGSIFLLAC